MSGAGEVLGPADRAAVDALIDEMHRADDLETFVEVVLVGLQRLIPSIAVAYGEVNPSSGDIVYRPLPEPGEAMLETLLSVMRDQLAANPLIQHFLRTGDTRAVMWSDLPEAYREFRRTEAYATFFGSRGVESQLAVALPAPEGIVCAFGLSRGPEGFSERDRAILNALRPHLVATHRALQSQQEAERWRSVLAAEGWAVVLVDAAGVVVPSVPGRPEPALHIGFPLEPGKALPEPLRSEIAQAVGGYHPTQLAARAGPIRVEAAGVDFEGWIVPSPIPPHVVLIRPRGVDRAALARMGLTARQIDVAVALAQGGTNRQIAACLGMAEATVKKHLEHIFAVLGVDNRAAAVAAIRSARTAAR